MDVVEVSFGVDWVPQLEALPVVREAQRTPSLTVVSACVIAIICLRPLALAHARSALPVHRSRASARAGNVPDISLTVALEADSGEARIARRSHLVAASACCC
jgi:hypothetical protein